LLALVEFETSLNFSGLMLLGKVGFNAQTLPFDSRINMLCKYSLLAQSSGNPAALHAYRNKF
jgi:hypothetical protein